MKGVGTHEPSISPLGALNRKVKVWPSLTANKKMTDPIEPAPSSLSLIPQESPKPGMGQSWLRRVAVSIGLASKQSPRSWIEKAVKVKGAFTSPERMMLRNILKIGGRRVADVMVPRAEIIAVEAAASLAELLSVFASAGHSRIPVYRDTLDAPLGMVHIKDLTQWVAAQSSGGAAGPEETANPAPLPGGAPSAAWGDTADTSLDLQRVDLSLAIGAARLTREVLYAPPSMPVVDLLLKMQATRIHLALVIDEYGGTDGLVSIEDLVEQIVGDIEDEHDVNGAPLIREEREGLIADARTPISELGERLGLDLSPPDQDDDVDTLGGLIFSLLSRVPVRGELVRHPAGIEFEVLEADPRRIKKLRIHLRKPPKKPAPPEPPKPSLPGKPQDKAA